MPYNPQTQYRGDVYLNRGLSAGLQSIADAIESKQTEKKDRARKFKGLQEYADAAGILPKEESTVMSLDQLEGYVRAKEYERLKSEAELHQRAVEEDIRASQDRRATGRRMQEFSQGLAAYAAAPSAGGTVANALASPGSGVTLSQLKDYAAANPVSNRVTPEAIMGIAGQSGILTPQMAAELAAMGQPRSVNEFPVSSLGQPRGSVGGNVFVPTSVHGGQLVPMTAGAGTPALPSVPGYTPVPTGRGGVQWLQDPKEVQATRARASTRLASLRKQRASLASKVEKGNVSVGPEFLGMGDRSAKLKGVEAEIAEIERQHPELAESPPTETRPTAAKFGDFAEGDIIKDKQGNLYRVVNGKPVPL